MKKESVMFKLNFTKRENIMKKIFLASLLAASLGSANAGIVTYTTNNVGGFVPNSASTNVSFCCNRYSR